MSSPSRELKLIAAAVFLVAVPVLCFLITNWPIYTDDNRDTARINVNTIAKTLTVYRNRFGAFPATLADLTKPAPDGGAPYLENDSLLDPWKRPYQFDPAGKRNRQPGVPDVWSFGRDPKDRRETIGNWK